MHPSLQGVNGVRPGFSKGCSNPRSAPWTRLSAVVGATGQPSATAIRHCSNYAVAY